MSYPNVDHKIAKIVLKREPSPKRVERKKCYNSLGKEVRPLKKPRGTEVEED